MKKRYVLMFLLCIILLFSATALTCSAETVEDDNTASFDESTIAFTVENASSVPGQTVQVPITISTNGKGICGATIRLSIDQALQLTNIQAGPAFSALTMTRPGSYDTSTPVILWDGMEEIQAEGVVAVLVFQAPMQAGNYQIEARCEAGDVIDGSLNDVDAIFVPGSITVAEETVEEPDFILPAALVTIEEEAFRGDAFTYVRLSENVTSIGARAFADCPNLRHIYIAEKTTSIDDDAFEGIAALVIHGVEGSYAQTYAQEHGFEFRAD